MEKENANSVNARAADTSVANEFLIANRSSQTSQKSVSDALSKHSNAVDELTTLLAALGISL
jgi:hypothetical protein